MVWATEDLKDKCVQEITHWGLCNDHNSTFLYSMIQRVIDALMTLTWIWSTFFSVSGIIPDLPIKFKEKFIPTVIGDMFMCCFDTNIGVTQSAALCAAVGCSDPMDVLINRIISMLSRTTTKNLHGERESYLCTYNQSVRSAAICVALIVKTQCFHF